MVTNADDYIQPRSTNHMTIHTVYTSLHIAISHSQPRIGELNVWHAATLNYAWWDNTRLHRHLVTQHNNNNYRILVHVMLTSGRSGQ